MKAYLRMINAKLGSNPIDVSENVGDVVLDVRDDTFLTQGAIIEGTISTGNHSQHDAHLEGSYPTVQLSNNMKFGAAIVWPTKGIPGVFPVGTTVRFRVE
jgi:hypothetical protein